MPSPSSSASTSSASRARSGSGGGSPSAGSATESPQVRGQQPDLGGQRPDRVEQPRVQRKGVQQNQGRRHGMDPASHGRVSGQLRDRDEQGQQRPGDDRRRQQRIHPVHHAAVTGQQIAHVLDPEIAFDQRFGQVPAGGDDGDCGPDDQALPPLAVQHQPDGQRTAEPRPGNRTGESLPGFLRRDGRRHRVFAEQHTGDVTAGVRADHHDHEGQDAPRAVVGGQHQRREAGQQAQIDRDENGRRHIGEVAGGARRNRHTMQTRAVSASPMPWAA